VFYGNSCRKRQELGEDIDNIINISVTDVVYSKPGIKMFRAVIRTWKQILFVDETPQSFLMAGSLSLSSGTKNGTK